MATATHRFDASGPLALALSNARGTVVVHADSPGEARVEVSTRHDPDAVHVELADDGHRLVVESDVRRFVSAIRVDLVVHLPPRSSMRITTASASVVVHGLVGNANVGTASGGVGLDQVEGYLEMHTASGSLRARRVQGDLRFRSASGSLRVDEVGGAAEARTASGSLAIGTAGRDVQAKSVSGHVEVREARSGTVDLRSTSGNVGVGVRRGSLVWLDVVSTSGRVESRLDGDSTPADGEHPLTVRAKSVSGSITIEPAGTPV